MWFWLYSGHDYPIPDPHKFVAYFYYRINCQVKEYDGDYDMLYSLATNILPKAGYPEADLYLNPYYMPEQDPKILAEVENWRKTLS